VPPADTGVHAAGGSTIGPVPPVPVLPPPPPDPTEPVCAEPPPEQPAPISASTMTTDDARTRFNVSRRPTLSPETRVLFDPQLARRSSFGRFLTSHIAAAMALWSEALSR
jgi:hypothetical protein